MPSLGSLDLDPLAVAQILGPLNNDLVPGREARRDFDVGAGFSPQTYRPPFEDAITEKEYHRPAVNHARRLAGDDGLRGRLPRRLLSGQKVEATLDAYPDWRIPGHVITIVPTADRQRATVLVRIGFEKLDPRILPDMGVKVSFLAGEQAAGQAAAKAVIPREAARTLDGKPVVFLFRDGLLERRAVSLGTPIGGDVQVTAGLAPGDKVVVEGPSELRDGQRAKLK